MNTRYIKSLSMAAMLVLALSATGVAQLPCGVPNEIYCQPSDGTDTLSVSQNDTNGYNHFASVYENFTFTQTWDVKSFHWVGGFFNSPVHGAITGWALTFYNDNAGQPGTPIASGFFPGNGGETFIGNVNNIPIYVYGLYFNRFTMAPGTYWASVVPDVGFPPEWGWGSSAVGDMSAYQDFFGARSQLGMDRAFAIDGTPVNSVPEPGTVIMLGTGILGLAGTLRRKLF
jgi:hypothetical protein